MNETLRIAGKNHLHKKNGFGSLGGLFWVLGVHEVKHGK